VHNLFWSEHGTLYVYRQSSSCTMQSTTLTLLLQTAYQWIWWCLRGFNPVLPLRSPYSVSSSPAFAFTELSANLEPWLYNCWWALASYPDLKPVWLGSICAAGSYQSARGRVIEWSSGRDLSWVCLAWFWPWTCRCWWLRTVPALELQTGRHRLSSACQLICRSHWHRCRQLRWCLPLWWVLQSLPLHQHRPSLPLGRWRHL